MVQLGRVNVPDTIACVIRDEADKINCPQYIALGIAMAESAFDPNAVGDNGCSIGLFQLNTCGGQGSDYANNKDALKDPRLNAKIALLPIAGAVYNCTLNGNHGEDLIRCVAVNSGHPGHVDLHDPRVTNIFNDCMLLIFNANGSPAVWPPNDPSRCSGVVPPPPPLGVWAEPRAIQNKDDAVVVFDAHMQRISQIFAQD